MTAVQRQQRDYNIYENQRTVRLEPLKHKKHKMNPIPILAGMVLLGVFVYISIQHLTLQSQITSCTKSISNIEKEYLELKQENDDEQRRVEASYNISEIKEVAMNELGMVYPEEGQIIYFDSKGSDYVKQFAEIPK